MIPLASEAQHSADHSIGINVASLQSQGSLGFFFVEEPLYHSMFDAA